MVLFKSWFEHLFNKRFLLRVFGVYLLWKLSVRIMMKKGKQKVLAELEKFKGDIFWKGEEGYEEAVAEATGENYNLVEKQPALVLRPKYSRDAVFAMKAIEVGRKQNMWGKIPFTVCGGGHSELCCENKAVLVHMKHMNFLEVRPDDNSIFVGAGVKLGDVQKACAKYNMACPLGTWHSVGCGLVLQGGIGYLSRLHSLTVDNIRSVRIVLPNGEDIQLGHDDFDVERKRNPVPFNTEDLFWAVRGAGPCFGLVTELIISIYPVQDVLQTKAIKPIDFLPTEADYLAQCEEVIRQLPKHQNCDMTLGFRGEDARVGFFPRSLAGKKFPGQLLLNLEIPESQVEVVNFSEISGGSLDLPEEAKQDQGEFSVQTQPGVYTYVRNALVDTLSVEGFRVLLNALHDAPSKMSAISLQHTGGKCRKKHNSAWGCRNFEFSVVIMAMWDNPIGQHRRDNVEWADALFLALEAIGVVKGTYPVDIDPLRRPKTFKKEAILAFGKEEYAKLQSLKKIVDPKNLVRGKYV